MMKAPTGKWQVGPGKAAGHLTDVFVVEGAERLGNWTNIAKEYKGYQVVDNRDPSRPEWTRYVEDKDISSLDQFLCQCLYLSGLSFILNILHLCNYGPPHHFLLYEKGVNLRRIFVSPMPSVLEVHSADYFTDSLCLTACPLNVKFSKPYLLIMGPIYFYKK